jgi:hypothetical protein
MIFDSNLEERFSYVCGNRWDSGIVDSNEDYPWLAPKAARKARALPK